MAKCSLQIGKLITVVNDFLGNVLIYVFFLLQDNNLCSSVLVLCHSWGEVHTNLLSADTG